jgi:hypothetical protein
VRQVQLEGRALHIFPCRADKKPTTPHGFKDASANPEAIARLWSLYPGPLTGVATGTIGGIDVIDVDNRNGGDKWFQQHRDQIPVTRCHETRGGLHFFFKHVIGFRCSSGRIAPGVDTKGDGGYVIWWPTHGGRVLCAGPIVDFPVWLAELVDTGGMGVAAKADHNGSAATPISPFPFLGPPTEHQINYARKALRIHTAELWYCREGSRNTKLNALAFKMGRLIVRGWITCDQVEHFLLKACKENGLLADDGEAQCRATIASGISAGMKRPYHDIEGAA